MTGYLEILTQLLALVLALLMGHSLATQGIGQGRGAGAINVKFGRYRIVWHSLQFRPKKFYFQAALLQTA